MKRVHSMLPKRLPRWTLIALALYFNSLDGGYYHAMRPQQAAAITKQYTLHDLGAVDLEEGMLSHQHEKGGLGPTINNRGMIIANRRKGGFIASDNSGEYQPAINGAKYYFYDLNNNGDLLGALQRGSDQLEWFVWPVLYNWNQKRLPIDTVELAGNEVTLKKINDSRVVVGKAHPKGLSMPLSWTPTQGLYRLGHLIQLQLKGSAEALNSWGWIAGKSEDHLEKYPYIWDGTQKADLFSKRSEFHIPSGSRIIFKDLLLSDNGLLYGTYWIDEDFLNGSKAEGKITSAFFWEPITGQFSLLDLQGMRLSGLNNGERIVGSLNGRAAFVEQSYLPIALDALIDPQELKGWELLEATDINDENKIVGYGRKEGKMHLFLAIPL